MMRMLGAVLVIAGCGALGLAGVARLDGRVRDLGGLAAGLDALQREMGWRPARGTAADFFSRCARGAREPDGQPFQQIWNTALSAAPLRLTAEDRVLLERLGPVLGRYDGDSQRLALEDTAAGLRSLQGDAADDRRRLGRVYGVLGMAAGLFVAILLI